MGKSVGIKKIKYCGRRISTNRRAPGVAQLAARSAQSADNCRSRSPSGDQVRSTCILLSIFVFIVILFFAPYLAAQESGAPEEPVQYQKRGERHYIFEGAQIKGSREKPRVIYILPWKDEAFQYDEKLEKDFKGEVLEPISMEDFESEVVLKQKIREMVE